MFCNKFQIAKQKQKKSKMKMNFGFFGWLRREENQCLAMVGKWSQDATLRG